jgi:thymidylate synthase
MNKADIIFQENLKEILYNGATDKDQNVRAKYKDGTPAYSQFITQFVEQYDISKGEFPIVTLRPLAWKSAIKEILWIYSDQSNDLNLLEEKYDIHWWNEWDIGDRTIGQRYGATVERYNLMSKLLRGLKEQPYGRRHIMNLYQYADFEETEGLYPCAFETQWSVRNGFLDLTLSQRSNDMLVASTINDIQYVALQLMVAKHCNLKPGKFMRLVQNLHIYDRHIDNAKILLERTPSEKQPKLILDTNKTNFYDFTIDDFKLIDFESDGEQLKFELAI